MTTKAHLEFFADANFFNGMEAIEVEYEVNVTKVYQNISRRLLGILGIQFP
jgi:hypothetical protein